MTKLVRQRGSSIGPATALSLLLVSVPVELLLVLAKAGASCIIRIPAMTAKTNSLFPVMISLCSVCSCLASCLVRGSYRWVLFVCPAAPTFICATVFISDIPLWCTSIINTLLIRQGCEVASIILTTLKPSMND